MILYKYILSYGSPIILIIGGLIGFYYLKHLSKLNHILLAYLVVSLIFDFVSRKIAGETDNNLLLWPLLSLSELIVFSLFYLRKGVSFQLIVGLLVAGISYMVLELYYIDVKDVIKFQPYSKVVSSFIIVVLSLFSLYDMLKVETIASLKSHYLNGVILAYFSLNILLLLPINFLINAKVEVTIYIWTIYLFSTIIFYVCLSFYIWRNGKNQKRLHCGSQ